MSKMFSVPGAPAPSPARHAWPSLLRACALGAGLALSLVATPALAQGKAAEAGDGAQAKPQNRMSRCSADFKATGRPGSERKAFMSECLRKPQKAS
ncbi:MAG: hypothetical protein JZU58_27680 [Curvibacter lanceolatus]|jgi:hypothetical protein|uniref:PsiF family protein n=1 Tax=Curvibacter lanceolatus TaxID=86182 RepID=UPI000365F41F|nr:PsiF family protein [Curvibacter lanceolatus]MBV5296137.1 hypothetical protein [Curvibacter lanceolatus]